MKSKEDIHDLLQRVLAMVTAAEAQVRYHGGRQLATRFGGNAITQNLSTVEDSLQLLVANGQQHGSAITNKLDHESLQNLVWRAEDIAANSQEDSEYVPLPGPQAYPDLPTRFFAETAALRPPDLAAGVGDAVNLAQTAGFSTSGLATASIDINALANSKGLEAYDISSDTSFSTTMHGPAGAGAANASRMQAGRLDPAKLAHDALEAAKVAQNPQPIEPGDYTVVFEPQAVSSMIGFLLGSFNARDADEGTTPLTDQLGQKLFSDLFTLRTVIDDPDCPASPIGQDGLAARPCIWVDNGVVQHLYHDRYWAKATDMQPDPTIYPVRMEGDDAGVDDLIADCDRGLLVKNLWYIRYVDERQLLLTGMTRNGLFQIENGKIVGPVTNLRFNESPLTFFSNIEALGKPQLVNGSKIPAVRSREFTFSSTTESV